uniref:G protein-coupled receptor kinase n=1 Tax=Calcidiscus leptoporus TaxID=127549 RepID=A0A7S0JK20_9EUKA|mmetsp:Transcript_7244/g.16936  ORF Transcript_7244/g.16936 Transcript_7244/m.16936 type:complete len:539 (+) Transcript_7244:96-1712(+)
MSARDRERMHKCLSKQAMLGQGPLSFEEILADPVNLHHFKRFCVQDFSTENLLFWLEVEEYREIRAPAYRKSIARKIYNKYIREDAPQLIGLNDAMRRNISAEMLTDPTVKLFSELQASVVLSMKLDIFPRFVDSDAYRELIELKFEDRKVVKMDDFDIIRFLGAGGFGMVLLANKKGTERSYAIKVIDKRILISQNQTHSIFREKEVLACVEHPFIVALRYAFQTDDHLCFVLDFIAGGNMYSDLMRGPYPHERTCFYAAQIVLATHHLHELNILYRDLKPDNVLLTLDGYVKLADMGAARGINEDGSISVEAAKDASSTASHNKTGKAVDPSRGRRMTITGTHGYRAPEVYERDYGFEADWWNVGILIVEMLTAENPLRGENRRESEYLTKHKDLSLPAYIHSSAKRIIFKFLERDPKKRLGCGEHSVREIKETSFFESIDWEALMLFEMKPPFEPDVEYEKPSRQPTPKDSSQMDYFCQMVDYMRTSMSMRASWPLKENDQKIFEDFDYTSNKVFEEELLAEAAKLKASPFGAFG